MTNSASNHKTPVTKGKGDKSKPKENKESTKTPKRTSDHLETPDKPKGKKTKVVGKEATEDEDSMDLFSDEVVVPPPTQLVYIDGKQVIGNQNLGH